MNLLNVQSNLTELRETNSQLLDQNTLLKAQISAVGRSSSADVCPTTSTASQTDIDGQHLDDLNNLIKDTAEKEEELEKMRRDQDDLLTVLTDQESKLNLFKNRLRELGETVEDDVDSDNNSVESENDP
ncbi:hypothetical protein NQ317_014870 [Molorchus minor]|uniref:Uso1/p115-like vesicle tethering protein C-terminal domain-containing protein n=1 Tax=Molorchus minor TaxID=1323400 RepID=A0ABQ9JRV8_9CUCU|nr:hypothetical protein NQ317_014870 [Molorchus minor]